MEALQVLFDKVRALLEEHDALDRALPNQAADGDSESDGEESSESKQLKKDYAVKTKEIQLLKKAVPEGLPDDGEFQYFLAVAELQKNIEELKVIKVMSEKNLSFLEQQFQLNENLMLELEDRKREYRRQREEDVLAQRDGNSEQQQQEPLDARIRATRLVYKELKTFLGEMLVRVAPEDAQSERSRLAHLLQDLYSAFCDHGHGSYVRLCQLDYDVNEHDVALLLRHGIIERNPDPEQKDSVRLVNFTE